MDLTTSVITCLVTIFAIMDPFVSLPPFLKFTKDCKEQEIRAFANKSVIIAGILAVVFVIIGPALLNALSITIQDFKIAGGIVLILLGLENAVNLPLFTNTKTNKNDGLDSAAVLIATPLLTGPGLMTSLVVLDNQNGILPVLIALMISLMISWVILAQSNRVRKLLGDRVILVISKVMGLFLMAIGISFIRAGILGS